jgi:carboxypeptidase C (cathepsin A)
MKIFNYLLGAIGLLINTVQGIKYSEEALLDQVIELPGLDYSIEFNQFSGYLNLPNSTKHLHYWFVESEVNPENAPVVFWTNGGPGCSGLIGFMTEQGPWRPDSNGNLQSNQWAWNKIANMVFLEQPTGVGFSYSDNTSEYRIGDDQAAKDNLAIIIQFLSRYPHLKLNPLYITSESYGGHYMPELSLEIIEYNKKVASGDKINFAGMAVGNPYVDYYSGSGAQMETYNNFNLLPKPLWDEYISNGCTNPLTMLNNSICSTYFLRFSKLIGNLNPYALEFPVCVTAQQSWFTDYLFDRLDSSKSTKYTLSPNAKLFDSVPLSDTYEPCEDNWANDYLNKLDVKKALHVREDIVWEECSRTTKYELFDKMRSTVRDYRQILEDKSVPDFKMMIYSGDVDGVCGTVYTQKWLFDLGFNYQKDYLWKSWTVQGQTAGYITKFNTPVSKESKSKEPRLTFATVHGAGHEVPTYKPEEAFVLFKAFLDNDWTI